MPTEQDVLDWADKAGILKGSTVDKQLSKFMEEVDELVYEIVNAGSIEEVEKEIGDVQVCLINLAHLLGTSAQRGLDLKYPILMSRLGKGRMVDGTFVKDEDLDCADVNKG